MRPRAAIRKFPRTAHLEGSAVQRGDEDVAVVRAASLAGAHVVITEKIDGANAGVWFDDDGELVLQSRGHALVGGHRERHFDGFKAWAHQRLPALRAALGDRYTLYGEWCYAKHTVFYDALPSWFVAFDLLDHAAAAFLATDRWHALLAAAALDVATAPVLHRGPLPDDAALAALIAPPSRFTTPAWRDALAREAAATPHVDVERTLRDTDPSGRMEGLYLKVERDGAVADRLKLVRPGFLQVVVDSDSHWLSRPIVKNRCASAPQRTGPRP